MVDENRTRNKDREIDGSTFILTFKQEDVATFENIFSEHKALVDACLFRNARITFEPKTLKKEELTKQVERYYYEMNRFLYKINEELSSFDYMSKANDSFELVLHRPELIAFVASLVDYRDRIKYCLNENAYLD